MAEPRSRLAAAAAPASGLCVDRAEWRAAGIRRHAALVAAALSERARAGQPAWAASQAPTDRGRPTGIRRAAEDRWAGHRLGHAPKPARRAGALPREWQARYRLPADSRHGRLLRRL